MGHVLRFIYDNETPIIWTIYRQYYKTIADKMEQSMCQQFTTSAFCIFYFHYDTFIVLICQK